MGQSKVPPITCRRRDYAASKISSLARPLSYEQLEDRFLLAADFGDAPAPYPTLLADNGPRHQTVGPFLGNLRDAEIDGLPNTELAVGDDLNGIDDEDGIYFSDLRVGQLGATVLVAVNNTPTSARLDAWIDFDRDGSWNGANEKIAASIALVPGEHTIRFDIPGTASPGLTFARFRISTAGGLGPGGPAADGEVQDVAVTLLPPVASGGQFGLPKTIANDINDNNNYVAASIGLGVSDLDNDGDMDVVSGAYVGGRLNWHENRGLDGFAIHEIAGGLEGLRRLQVTDLDHDGDDDIVVVSGDPSGAAIYELGWHENNGAGNFQRHVIAAGTGYGATFDVADIDADGDLDIVAARDGGLTLYTNNQGQFTSEVLDELSYNASAVDVIDLDRDGDIDIVSAAQGQLSLFRQDDNGFVKESVGGSSSIGHLVVAANLDEDFDIELAAASWAYEGSLKWLDNYDSEFWVRGNLSYTGYTYDGRVLQAADMDGNGNLDLISSRQNSLLLTANLGNGQFGSESLIAATQYAAAVSVADMDGDGDLDAVVAGSEDNTIVWYENTDYRITAEYYAMPEVSESDTGSQYGTLLYRRSGNIQLPLTITLSLIGTATYGVDYDIEGATVLPDGTVRLIFPAGASLVGITIRPRSDTVFELAETAGTQVLDGANYRTASAGAQLVLLVDDDAADFGDAPFPYPTTRARDGANHGPSGPRLGNSRDAELDAPPTTSANGDNSVGNADEDGVSWGTIRVGQLDSEITVNVQNASGMAFVDAWIDFNGDGNWGGAGEQILAKTLVVNGANVLKFDVPGLAFAGTTYARVRISSVGSLSYVGAALDGEVEDYKVAIVPPAPSLGRFVPHDIATTEFDYTHAAYPADIDNDGDMDVIATSRDGLVWHENMGDGSFEARLLSTAEDVPRYVQVMDFDRDGDLDILTIEADPDPQWLGNWIAVHENLGDGVFGVRGLVQIYSQEWMSAQDIDLDGDTDLLINNGYYENHNGTFELRRLIYVDARMHHAIDFDRDGDLDLVSTELYDSSQINNPDRGGFGWQENKGGLYFERHRVSSDEASWVSAGDMDGDGDMDLIAARTKLQGLAWYENKGSNNFTTHEIAPWPHGSGYRFTLSDIDGDGDLDTIALGDEYDDLWTYRNDGDGNFTEETLMPSVGQVYTLATADMDNDGDLDIISGQFSGGAFFGNLTWYENVDSAVTAEHSGGVIGENGATPGRIVLRRTGTITEGLTVSFTLAGTAVYQQDYTLAGVATLASGVGTVFFPAGVDSIEVTVTVVADSVLESNEAVQFSLLAGEDYLVDSQLASVVRIIDDEVGDFGDAPGRYPTLLVKDGARHGAHGPMLGTERDSEANGQPTDQANGDNLPASGEDGIQFGLLQVGQFGGTVTVTMSGRITARLDAWIDFDGDGGWSGAQEQVANSHLIQSGANVITFDIPATAKSGVTYARFRVSTAGGLGPIGAAADGEVEDVVVEVRPPSATTAEFTGTPLLNYGTSLDQVLAADLDGDGDLDAIGTNSFRDEIYWYENLGPQQFERHTITTDASTARRLLTADIDSDGDVDILAPGYNSIEWYRNNGTGSFSRTSIATEFTPNTVEVVDLDADGDLDLLATGDPTARGGGLAWYENDRNVFQYHLVDDVSAHSVVAADFDYDGDIDIVAGIGGITPQLDFYRNDGSHQFTPSTLELAHNSFQSVIGTDLNRDGYADILFFHQRNGNHELGWLQNDGAGGFYKRTITETSVYYGTPAIADVEGDGDQDLLVPVYAYNRLLLFANQGDGNFDLKAIDSSATGIQSMAAGDFDGDGDLDILTGRANSKPMVYYENRSLFNSGDFDSDGDVDGRDFLAWQRGFGQTANAHRASGDANQDRAVDQADLGIWQQTYGALGDVDGDSRVNGRDFLAWQRGYGKSSGAVRNEGDMSGDGAVDAIDLAIWQTYYGTPSAHLTSATTAASLVSISTRPTINDEKLTVIEPSIIDAAVILSMSPRLQSIAELVDLEDGDVPLDSIDVTVSKMEDSTVSSGPSGTSLSSVAALGGRRRGREFRDAPTTGQVSAHFLSGSLRVTRHSELRRLL